jgi:cysteinyl-tRNA synthetase
VAPYKRDPMDFVLWKPSKPGEPSWRAPWSEGRPGWHIECSAMSMKYLGEHFDIHCGGVDNIFPHHENEIAQSEGTTGHKFVNYWLHAEHLIVEGRKMAKSFGNFFRLADILDKGYPGTAVRYLLISTHYRQQLNFTFDGLEAARGALERYNDFISNLTDYPGGTSDGTADKVIETARNGFEENLDDDLNISGALGSVFDFIRDINKLKAEDKLSTDERDRALGLIKKFDTVLNFQLKQEALDSEVEELIEARTQARKSKNFELADKIRGDLLRMGIVLEDTPQGVKWKRKV